MSGPGFTSAVNCVIIQEHIKNAPRNFSGLGELSQYSDLLQAGQSGDRWGRDFLHLSRPALGSTQPPIQWVPGPSC